MPDTLTLVALALCFLSLSAARSIDPSRLVEKDITLTADRSGWQKTFGVPIVDPPKRSAGYFKLDGATKSAQMFFFHFQARMNPTQAPVVLWMTGGPGCSSELAILYENGPYKFDVLGRSLVETQYGWDVTHNMIFVDQPIGAGFSYSDSDADTVYGEKGVADDMLDFFHHFFAAHPDLAKLPLFITGESYAGHYVPAVAHRVWLSNKNKEGDYINLQGLAVGNGLTEPSIQYDAYGDFALQAGLIGQLSRSWMKFLFPLCRLGNEWCESTNWDWVCSIGNTYCQMTQFVPILDANPDINIYDYTKKCAGTLCYDFSAAEKYLNLPATKEALGVAADRHWLSCNYEVYGNFAGDWLHRFDTVLPDMLAEGIKVMIYAGDLDVICNYVGNRRWVDALDWYGTEGWDDATDKEWLVGTQAAGKVKQWGPLAFVQVYKAGHMVPMDQPLNALAMITAWTRNHTVSDVMSSQRASEDVASAAAAAAASSSSTSSSKSSDSQDVLRVGPQDADVEGGSAVVEVVVEDTSRAVAALFARLTRPSEAVDHAQQQQVPRSSSSGGKRHKCSRHQREGAVNTLAKQVGKCSSEHAARFVGGLRAAAAKVQASITQTARKILLV